ncbi:MAG: hypothetical protein WCF24_04725 [Acidimicrobiales bacterium]
MNQNSVGLPYPPPGDQPLQQRPVDPVPYKGGPRNKIVRNVWLFFNLVFAFGIAVCAIGAYVESKHPYHNNAMGWAVTMIFFIFAFVFSVILFYWLPWFDRQVTTVMQPMPTAGQIYDAFVQTDGYPPSANQIAQVQTRIRNEKLLAGGLAFGSLFLAGHFADIARK